MTFQRDQFTASRVWAEKSLPSQNHLSGALEQLGALHAIKNDLGVVRCVFKLIDSDALHPVSRERLARGRAALERVISAVCEAASSSSHEGSARALPALVAAVGERVRDHAAVCEVHVIFDTVSVACDVDQCVEELLVNLLNNAIDASHQGGVVRVVVCAGGEEVVITVEDEGAGMPSSVADSVGRTRLNSSQASGSGLGLFLASESLRAIGGTLEISTAAHRGTRATVIVPSVVIAR